MPNSSQAYKLIYTPKNYIVLYTLSIQRAGPREPRVRPGGEHARAAAAGGLLVGDAAVPLPLPAAPGECARAVRGERAPRAALRARRRVRVRVRARAAQPVRAVQQARQPEARHPGSCLAAACLNLMLTTSILCEYSIVQYIVLGGVLELCTP